MSLSLCILLTYLPAAAPERPDVPQLLAQLKAGDAAKSNQAAEQLGKLGPEDKDAVKPLIEALEDNDPVVTTNAVRGLAAIGAPAVPALNEALKSKKKGVPGLAAGALRRIGPPAKDSAAALAELINNSKGRTRDGAEAIEALARIAPKTKEALPGLRAALTGPVRNPGRTPAAIALGEMGSAAKDAVPDLVKLLDEPPGKAGPIRFHAARALGQIGPDAKEAVPALVKLLQDSKAGPGRRLVAEALGGIGPAAKDAVAALKEARQEPALREAADKALAKIQADR
jgi:HEAT repeat protein